MRGRGNEERILLPDNLRGVSIHQNVIPTVCNLKNMLNKLKFVSGNYYRLKYWEKRCYKAYKIDKIEHCILDNPADKWQEIIKEHILSRNPKDFGANCIDIYLVAYVAENYGSGRQTFFQYIKDTGISDKKNSAQAIWQVGKGDGVYLNVLYDDGTVKDWDFFARWLNKKDSKEETHSLSWRDKDEKENQNFNRRKELPVQFASRVSAVFSFLVRAAKERRLVTYSELAEEVKCKPINVGKYLYRIADLCKENDAPPLTSIVVSKGEFAPSEGLWKSFPEVQEHQKNSTWAEMIREVYLFDWSQSEELFQEQGEHAGQCPQCGAKLVWRKARRTGESYRGCTNFSGGCRYNDRSY